MTTGPHYFNTSAQGRHLIHQLTGSRLCLYRYVSDTVRLYVVRHPSYGLPIGCEEIPYQ